MLNVYNIVLNVKSFANEISKYHVFYFLTDYADFLLWLALDRRDPGDFSDFPRAGAADLYHSHAVWAHCPCCWKHTGDYSTFFKHLFNSGGKLSNFHDRD